MNSGSGGDRDPDRSGIAAPPPERWTWSRATTPPPSPSAERFVGTPRWLADSGANVRPWQGPWISRTVELWEGVEAVGELAAICGDRCVGHGADCTPSLAVSKA